MSQDQLDWFEAELDAAQAAGERVIVFSHFPLEDTIGYDLWNAHSVHTLFSRYDHVAGFFGGHHHRPYAVSGTYCVFRRSRPSSTIEVGHPERVKSAALWRGATLAELGSEVAGLMQV